MSKLPEIDYTREDDLTIEEVRACHIFSNLTDEEVRQVIETLKQFAKIAYDFYKKEAENAKK